MNKFNLLPGQKLRLLIGKSKNIYLSQVEDISKDGTILIDSPIHNSHIVPIRIGSVIQVIFFNKQGLFIFYAKVINRFTGNLSLLHITPISSVERLQRRQYFRLEKTIPFTYIIKDDQDGKIYKGIIEDISGGGLKCKVDIKLEVGTIIICNFVLECEINVTGKVIRFDEFKEKGYEIGICYIDIDERIREKIISYIFKEQRKNRLKGIE